MEDEDSWLLLALRQALFIQRLQARVRAMLIRCANSLKQARSIKSSQLSLFCFQSIF